MGGNKRDEEAGILYKSSHAIRKGFMESVSSELSLEGWL